MGVVTYGNEARLEFHLDKYQTTRDVIDAIKLITWHDAKTNTSGGVR